MKPARAAILVRGVDDAERLDRAVTLASRAGVTVTLALDAATAVAVARTRPDVSARLRAAFADGTAAAMLTTAHGAEAALLRGDELADELRLDEETLQLLYGVTLERRGFVGAGETAALEEAGIDFVIGDGDEPYRVGERLIALPIVVVDVDGLEQAARGLGAPATSPAAWAAELTPPWLRCRAPAGADVPEALRALAALGEWCAAAFGLRRVPGVAAAALVDEAWRLERFPARARVPLVRRRGLHASRRAWVAAYEWCDVLSVEARVPGLAAHAQEPLDGFVLPALRAMGETHGAGEPLVRAEAAYEELRAFRFLGAQRWRALMTALRDAFALLASRRDVDWSVKPTVDRRPSTAEQPVLRLVEDHAAHLN
jgi:hypothetical protein